MQTPFSAPKFSSPKKALGQNFLQDQNIIRNIIRAFNPQTEDIVVEIGPGRGALTEHLLSEVKHLHLVEFDYELVEYWAERAKKLNNLTVHHGDALKFDFASLVKEKRAQEKSVLKKSVQDQNKIRIIGNLPYNISSPILFHLMSQLDYIQDITAMLQLEVVQRMAAAAGSKQYGRLSVMLQQSCDVQYLFKVPPNAFYPPPKVDSAIARLQPYNPPIVVLNNQKTFATVVKSAFAQRRKTLRNTLKSLMTAEQIEQAGIDPAARAETLSVQQFVDLANLLEFS